jgi:polar amino acid transport system substrate-binding protein
VNFTDGYFLSKQALTVNIEETPDIASTADLGEGDTVAVEKGTTGEIWARENLEPNGVTIRSFPDAPATYLALEAGNVTGVIFDEPSAIAEAAERPTLEVVELIDTGEVYGIAVDPANEPLLEATNILLAEVIGDGTYKRIFDAYSELPPGGSIAEAGS